MEIRKHFDGKRFFNPDAPQAQGLAGVLRWKLTSRPAPSPGFIADVEPSQPHPLVEGGAVCITLINHSTVLLQQGSTHILTDPIWSERASPFASLGPRRHRDPGVRFADLPRIDAVLLSHNHYDHLDLPTLRRLAARPKMSFVVPLGVAKLLRSKGIGPVVELDWGESHILEGATIHCVPALHFSARGAFDRNRTLWCGYVIVAGGRVAYFAGDTAFGSHFAAIRRRFGSPHVALLPIGAYQPRWFMSSVHMSPGDAVRAHGILAPQTSIAIHHGTFQLADEAIDEPSRQLAALSPGDSFRMLRNGESFTLL